MVYARNDGIMIERSYYLRDPPFENEGKVSLTIPRSYLTLPLPRSARNSIKTPRLQCHVPPRGSHGRTQGRQSIPARPNAPGLSPVDAITQRIVTAEIDLFAGAQAAGYDCLMTGYAKMVSPASQTVCHSVIVRAGLHGHASIYERNVYFRIDLAPSEKGSFLFELLLAARSTLRKSCPLRPESRLYSNSAGVIH